MSMTSMVTAMTMNMTTLILMGTSTNMSTRTGRGFIMVRNMSTGTRIHMFTRIRIPTRETGMSMRMKRKHGEW
jgi:hypothetical protein